MPLARQFDQARHDRYVRYLDQRFAKSPHPDPDLTRDWVNMVEVLGRDEFDRIRAWVAAADYEDRPGSYIDSTTHPGGVWSMGDPVSLAVGRRLEEAVSEIAGRRLWISYGGITVHSKGVPVVRHRDINDPSKYLLSWAVALDIDKGWPIYMERPGDEPGTVEVDEFDNTNPERAFFSCGHDVWHWRDPYPGEIGRLLFMRYTANDSIRSYSVPDTEAIIEHGEAELRGQTPPPLKDGVVVPYCNILAEPEPDFVVVPGLLSSTECRAIIELGSSDLQRPSECAADAPETAWFERIIGGWDCGWIWDRLKREVAAAAGPLVPQCPHRAQYVPVGRLLLARHDAGTCFHWHRDHHEHPQAPIDESARIGARRVSVIVAPQNADAGGCLELDSPEFEGLEPGDAVLFASREIMHRVTPVEQGTRYSLTAWYGVP